MKKPFAIRLTAQDTHGSTYSRVYSRGAMRLTKQAFVSFAIGDLLMLISEGEFSALREYVITNMEILSNEEAFAIWKIDAEVEIERQQAILDEYVRDVFKMP